MDINGFDWKKSANNEDLDDSNTNPDLERMEEAFKKSSDKSCSRIQEDVMDINGFDFIQMDPEKLAINEDLEDFNINPAQEDE